LCAALLCPSTISVLIEAAESESVESTIAARIAIERKDNTLFTHAAEKEISFIIRAFSSIVASGRDLSQQIPPSSLVFYSGLGPGSHWTFMA